MSSRAYELYQLIVRAGVGENTPVTFNGKRVWVRHLPYGSYDLHVPFSDGIGESVFNDVEPDEIPGILAEVVFERRYIKILERNFEERVENLAAKLSSLGISVSRRTE
jgi:hypothetical protein